MLDLFHGMSSDNSELDLISAPHRATLDSSQERNNPGVLMEPKSTTATTLNPSILRPAMEEVEVWEPPFERWIHLADMLLARSDRSPQPVDRL